MRKMSFQPTIGELRRTEDGIRTHHATDNRGAHSMNGKQKRTQAISLGAFSVCCIISSASPGDIPRPSQPPVLPTAGLSLPRHACATGGRLTSISRSLRAGIRRCPWCAACGRGWNSWPPLSSCRQCTCVVSTCGRALSCLATSRRVACLKPRG